MYFKLQIQRVTFQYSCENKFIYYNLCRVVLWMFYSTTIVFVPQFCKQIECRHRSESMKLIVYHRREVLPYFFVNSDFESGFLISFEVTLEQQSKCKVSSLNFVPMQGKGLLGNWNYVVNFPFLYHFWQLIQCHL